MIHFDLGCNIIKESCNFTYYFNKTDIKPTVLDGQNEIILANWTDDKCIVCNVNKIPSFHYVLINRSVLCNCGIKVENNFLLESLAAYHDAESKLVMHFTLNTAFDNYSDNLNESLKFSILLNWNTHKQTLPNSL